MPTHLNQKVAVYRKLSDEGFPLRFNLIIGIDYLDDVINGKIPQIHTDYLRIASIKVFHEKFIERQNLLALSAL